MFGANSRSSFLGRVYADGIETPPPAPSGTSGTEAKFTQEDVNKFMAEEKRKYQEKVTQLQTQVTQFQGTAKEKEALQEKLADMQKQFLTKEELAKQDAEKAKHAYENDLKKTTAERDEWKTRYIKNVADVAIADAATTHRAFNPDQLRALLGPQVEVKQKVNEQGVPTNEFDVLMAVNVKAEDGTFKTLQMNVKDGVAKMRDNPNFANLFLVDSTPGTGVVTLNNGGSTSVTSNTPPSDPAEYRAWRAKQKTAGRI